MRVGALLVSIALAASGCSSDPSEESTTVPADTEAVSVESEAAPVEAAPAADEGEPVEDGRVPVDEEVPVEEEADVPCDPAAILAILTALYSGYPTVVDVDIAECHNGYARVWAIPDMSDCLDPESPCLESEQVFLRYDGGTWQYVDSGTGIDCSDTGGLIPETVAACDALSAP